MTPTDLFWNIIGRSPTEACLEMQCNLQSINSACFLMGIICIPFSVGHIHQNWFLSLTFPKIIIPLTINKVFAFGKQFCYAPTLLLHPKGQEMKHLIGSYLQDMLGKVTTFWEAESVDMRYPNFVTHKITQKHFQMEITWTFSEFLWFWSKKFHLADENFHGNQTALWKSPFCKTPWISIMKKFKQKTDDHTSNSWKIAWRWSPRSS